MKGKNALIAIHVLFKSIFILLAREIALTTSRCISFTLTLIIVLIWGIESLNYILAALGIIILLQSIVVGNFLEKKLIS